MLILNFKFSQISQGIIEDLKTTIEEIVISQENQNYLKVQPRKMSIVNKTKAIIDPSDELFAKMNPSECDIQINKVFIRYAIISYKYNQ